MKKHHYFLLALVGILGGCRATIYPTTTVEPHTKNQELVETTLKIPAGLQVLSIDYDAELYTLASDGDTYDEGEHGRAFVKVHAVDRRSEEHYLLIYESLGHRSSPVQIIRFQQDQ